MKNGTPQGCIVSPLLFSAMINDVFEEVELGLGFSLFADDGALWKRGGIWSSLWIKFGCKSRVKWANK